VGACGEDRIIMTAVSTQPKEQEAVEEEGKDVYEWVLGACCGRRRMVSGWGEWEWKREGCIYAGTLPCGANLLGADGVAVCGVKEGTFG
jgi:hypothetical protein